MWVTNKSGYDIVLAGVLLHKNSQQQLTTAEATALNNNAMFTAMITEGVSLIASENQPEANPHMYVRATDSVPTLNGIPSNPKGYPAVSPSETFDIGKEEGDADLEDNKEVSITENGEIEITPTEGKDGMKKVTANVAVPVPVLEANKATTIDVSAYTEPIEVTPTSGKAAMEKNTITLNNIPSGGGAPSISYPMCLGFVNAEYAYDHFIGVLANGTIAQSTSDIPNIKWFVNVEGSSSGRTAFTSSQDLFESAFGNYSSDVGVIDTRKECTIETEGSNVSITYGSESHTTNLVLSDNIPLMLFVGMNPTS